MCLLMTVYLLILVFRCNTSVTLWTNRQMDRCDKQATLLSRHMFLRNLLTYVNNLTTEERKDVRRDRTDMFV